MGAELAGEEFTLSLRFSLPRSALGGSVMPRELTIRIVILSGLWLNQGSVSRRKNWLLCAFGLNPESFRSIHAAHLL
jgi:hypothetical protein